MGVDFSGAVHAGKYIWLSEGRVTAGLVSVHTCRPISELAKAAGRKKALSALRDELTKDLLAAGLDFPFALPVQLMDGFSSWADFVLQFADTFGDPATFRAACWAKAKQKELRRQTDVDAKTPFSPYNLRMYLQTFYGIRDVLGPLVADESIQVLPMQPKGAGTRVIEICPASSLKGAGGNGWGKTQKLQWLQQSGLSIPDSITQMALDDSRGDALDSLIALHATAKAVNTNSALLRGHQRSK